MAAIAAFVSGSAPIDSSCLRRLVEREPFAPGPEAHVSSHGGIALAAAWRGDSAFASRSEWEVVFDGRLDDRAGLRARLRDAGSEPPAECSDAALVVHAFAEWGASSLEKLLGEFAVCAWDRARRTVVAARDRFGVKPLFHAAVPGGWIVASSLAALRGWPGMAARLDDSAIGDFLLFGEQQDPRATCFAGISRVAAGGWASCATGAAPQAGSYFSLRAPAPLRYRDPRDYVARFRDVLDAAVHERAAAPVSILMSGGLDSSSVAAAARASGLAPDQCLALTAVNDTLFADEERRFSSVTARALGVPIEHVPVDQYELFARWDGDAAPPEPSTEVLSAILRDLLRRAERHGAVALTGDGGDPVLLPGAVVRHLGRMPRGELVRGVWRTMRRSLWPPLGLRSGLLRRAGAGRREPPPWLSARLRQACDVPARWTAHHDRRAPLQEPRGEALAVLTSPGWPQSFETADPNTTGLGVELRYPFFDARVVSLALSLPSYPWCVNKTVLREAMRGRLPDAIRLRPKTALAGDPVAARAWPLRSLVALLKATPAMEAYVDVGAFERTAHDDGLMTDRQPGTLAAAALATWLNTAAGRTSSV